MNSAGACRHPIDMQFATDHRPPDFTLTHPRAVLEKNVDTEVPLVVTNLDSATVAYDRLTTGGRLNPAEKGNPDSGGRRCCLQDSFAGP